MVFHWFRRDLRLEDNAALYQAVKHNKSVQCVFIFDSNILSKLEDQSDARVNFIHKEVLRLKHELQQLGSDLWIFHGNPESIWKDLVAEHKPLAIYCNRDYEPYAVKRDKEISTLCSKHEVLFHQFKDHVIFEQDEILKDDGTPYVVFTPYSKKWKAKLSDFYLKPYPTEKYFDSFHQTKPTQALSLEELGFKPTSIRFPEKQTTVGKIKGYEKFRDFPAINGTTRLSVHFRFGTISIRDKARKGYLTSEKWLNELIWRDFYIHILHHFPYVANSCFKSNYNHIPWRNNIAEFEAWCNGKTGYPLVDAGMRELNATGFMHNRVRMVVSSFLTKHLLIDWRLGEAYFASKLLDYELASNNGGWQWAAGCGVDAAPYFRIFNPHTQLSRFDKQLNYVKKWVPEYSTSDYPQEIVEHKMARERCLNVYKTALASLK
ncbi:MAG: DNA photolyase family protein [Bacteroidia bacterium]|nr:DNA photolyase family protein [Bacteroidia bacterium]